MPKKGKGKAKKAAEPEPEPSFWAETPPTVLVDIVQVSAWRMQLS